MIFLKHLVIIAFISLISINSINGTEDEYEDDYEISDQMSINGTDLMLNESMAMNRTDDDYYEYDDEDEDECTVDSFIDHYSELLLPEDYEEGKQLDFNQKSYTFSESIARVKRLHQYQQNVSRKMEPIIKRLGPRLSELLFYIDLPSDCMASLVRIGQALRGGEKWAMRFVDSMPSGKVASLQINSLPFGEYDECLEIESPDNPDKEKPKIYGHYCSLGLPPNVLPESDSDHIEDYKIISQMLSKKLLEQLNSSESGNSDIRFAREQLQEEMDGQFLYGILRYIEYLGPEKVRLPPGLCLPSTCAPKDVEYAINKILFPMTRFSMTINPDCDYKDKPVEVDKYQIISIASIASVTVICIICSLICLSYRALCPKTLEQAKSESQLMRITKCFSIVPNFKSIFTGRDRKGVFSALDGIRVILCLWLFMQHEYESGFLPLHTRKAKQSAPYQFNHQLRYIFFINLNLIDTFFLIAGFMASYILLTKMEKNGGKFDYIQYSLYRYLRILPIILTAIAITFIIELFGDGPLWPLVTDVIQKPCRDNPLPTIFMMNNYVSWPDIVTCVPISWYSAADMQLYLLAPLIVLIIYNWPSVGVMWNVIVVIIGSFIALAPKMVFGIPHIFESHKTFNLDVMAKTMTHQFWGIEQHFQLYIVGILLAYIVRRHPGVYLGGRWGESLIWLSTWALTFFAIFWHRNYLNLAEYKVTQLEIIEWIALSKLCYAAGWCWTIFACCTGRAGIINGFFSWRGFKPFANLLLEIYMLHLFIIIYRVGTTREHVFYTNYYVWTIMIFDFILTFILSIFVNVLVTKPFANLLQMFITRNRSILLEENNVFVNNIDKNGKLEPMDNNNNNTIDVIVMTNVAIDDIQGLNDKEAEKNVYFNGTDNTNEMTKTIINSEM